MLHKAPISGMCLIYISDQQVRDSCVSGLFLEPRQADQLKIILDLYMLNIPRNHPNTFKRLSVLLYVDFFFFFFLTFYCIIYTYLAHLTNYCKMRPKSLKSFTYLDIFFNLHIFWLFCQLLNILISKYTSYYFWKLLTSF